MRRRDVIRAHRAVARSALSRHGLVGTHLAVQPLVHALADRIALGGPVDFAAEAEAFVRGMTRPPIGQRDAGWP